MLFGLLPNGIYCSRVISSVHESVRLDPHRKPVQVRNTLNHIDGHGGHFCALHRQREQACAEQSTQQLQPPNPALNIN